MARELRVSIVGDASSFQRALGQATGHTSKFGSALGTMAKAGAIAAGAAGVGAVFVTLKQGIREFTESTKVAAQTEAAIKSTGGAAHVTAGHIDELANSLLNKSGVDDEAIKSGENMLLTFTGIRNETGKGNDVFDQATKAVLDLDTAMSGGNVTAENMRKTSILVGKALQDPVKGATALRRVGVALDAAQQKQIASFIKSGDTMKAQKVILHELNKEVGGSAKAIGDTLPGQINKLKENFNNLAGALVGAAVPALTKFTGFLNDKVLPAVSKAFTQIKSVISFLTSGVSFQAKVDVVIGAVKGLAERVGQIAGDIAGALKSKLEQVNWASTGTKIGKAISNALTFTTEKLGALLTAILSWVQAHAAQFGQVGALIGVYIITTLTDPSFWASHWQLALSIAVLALGKGLGRFAPEIAKLGGALGEKLFLGLISTKWGAAAVQIIEKFSGAFSKLGGTLVVIVTLAVATAVRAIIALVGSWVNAGIQLGNAVAQGVRSGMKGVAGAVIGAFQALWAWIKGAANSARAYAFGVGAAIIQGITAGLASALGGLLSKAAGIGTSVVNAIKHPLKIGSPSKLAADEIGKPLADGIALGFILGLNDLPEKVKPAVSAALQKIQAHVQTLQSAFADSFGRLTEYALKAFDARTTAIIAAIGAKFDGLRDKVRDKFDGLRGAIQTGLDKAKTAIDLELDIHLQGIEDWAKQLTPAEQALKKLQDEHDAAQRQMAITSAQSDLTAALATGDPDKILAAQKALDDALYTQKIFDLQKAADEERAIRDKQAADLKAATELAAQNAKDALDQQAQAKIDAYTKQEADQIAALDKQQANEELNAQARRDLQRQHLEDQLADLEAALEKHPKAWRTLHKKIQALFDKFGIDYKQAGQDLGAAFAQGIKESQGDVEKAITALLTAVSVKLPHSPAKEGPLKQLPDWDAYLSAGLSRSVATVNSMLGGLTGVGGSAPAATGGFATATALGGQAVIVNVYGSVTSERDLAETIRQRLLDTGRNNSSIFGQYA